jgi:hypothetical protein
MPLDPQAPDVAFSWIYSYNPVKELASSNASEDFSMGRMKKGQAWRLKKQKQR